MNRSSNFSNTSSSSIEFSSIHFFSQDLIFIAHIVYSSVLTIGLIANIFVGISQIQRKYWTSVGIFTFNLVVSDVLTLLFYVPTQMVLMDDQLAWNMGNTMCVVVNTILPTTLCCTIGTLLAISFDRLYAILKPFQWRMNSIHLAKVIVPLIWTISLTLNVPIISHAEVKYFHSTPFCDEGWESVTEGETFWSCMFVFSYLLPVIILVFTNSYMIRIIRNNSMSKYHSQNTKILKMGIYLVLVFTVCTGFQHVYFFVTASFSSLHLTMDQMAVFYVFSNSLVSVQACINPFLYGTHSRSLRCVRHSRKRLRGFSRRFTGDIGSAAKAILKGNAATNAGKTSHEQSPRYSYEETFVTMDSRDILSGYKEEDHFSQDSKDIVVYCVTKWNLDGPETII